MGGVKKEKIIEFFDKMSIDRNLHLVGSPILKYEQETRQRAVVELLEPKHGDKILDVGCGNARDILVYLKTEADCVGIDFSISMVLEGRKELAKKDLESPLLVGDATKLPFKNGVFDKVCCSEVIEHIPDYERAIIELVRVLKKGGKIVITTPNKSSMYATNKLYSFVVTKIKRKSGHPFDEWKTEKEIVEVLADNGIKIEKKVGICFLPGVFAYKSPKALKNIIVKITSNIEKRVRWKLHTHGYMLGISGIKQSERIHF